MNTNTNTNRNNCMAAGQKMAGSTQKSSGKAGGAAMIFFGILFLVLLSQPSAQMVGAVLPGGYTLANLIGLGLLIGGIAVLCRGGKQNASDSTARTTQSQGRPSSAPAARPSAAQTSYRYAVCPDCGRRFRVPTGKGDIQVICPNCRHSFLFRS